jgi:hypothetical protein
VDGQLDVVQVDLLAGAMVHVNLRFLDHLARVS